MSTLLILLLLVSQQDVPRISEEIVVERIIVDAYITDSHGSPLRGLTRDDLRVRVGRREAEIEAIDWIPAAEIDLLPEVSEDDITSGDPAEFEGRRLVIFFQRNVQRWSSRVTGQMKMIDYIQAFVDRLSPRDLVAVVSFDSHLRLEQDFTNDRTDIRKAVSESLLIDDPDPKDGNALSLFDHISTEEARGAAALEDGLLLVARALNELSGGKSLIFLGYGFGEFGSQGPNMPTEYREIRELFERGRTSLFALDTTNADFHTLETGLRRVAEESGGYYAKTHIFPENAIDRLERTLSGRYEIVVKRPAGLTAAKKHSVQISLRGRRGSIWSKKRWVD